MKKLLYAVVALVVLVVAAAALAPVIIDEARIKARIVTAVKAATGRDLAIDGHLEIALLPTPRLSLNRLRLSNLKGASARYVVRLKALEASLALAPLLGGELSVTSLRLVEPVIELERLADGRVNWSLAGVAPRRQRGGAATVLGGMTLSVDRLTIVNGTLTYRDSSSGRLERFEGIEARFSAASLQGPFAAVGSARLRAVGLAFELAIGRLQAGRSLSLQALLKLGQRGARVTFAGALSAPGAKRRLRGKLHAEGASLADLLGAVAKAVDSRVAVPALFAQPFRLETQVTASATAAGFNDLVLTVGKARATGAVSVAMTGTPQVDVTLAVNRLDLDAWLRSAAAARGNKAGREEAGPAPWALALPADIGGSLELSLEAVTYLGGVIRQIQVEGSLGNGRFDLARASALLPGSSDILISGTVLTEGDQSRFEGRVEAASDNLRRLIGWLGIDVDRVPVDRLHKLSLTSSVRLTPELAQANGIDLRLDTSRLTGAAAYAFRERPSFSLDVVVDRFNLDAYLPGQGAGGDGERPRPSFELPSLAVLESFDSNLKARVGKLVVNELQVSGLSLDASLVGGSLQVREASVENFAGASAALSGTVRSFAANPAVRANLDVRASDAGRLWSALGANPPEAVARLGAARLRGSLEGRVDDLKIDMELTAADARVGIEGGVSPSNAERRFDLRLDLSHPDLARFAAILGLGRPPPAFADSPFKLKGSVVGNLDAFELDLAAEAGAAVVSVAGDLIAFATDPAFDLRLSLDHPSLVEFATLFGIAFEPLPGHRPGPIAARGRIVGSPRRLTLDRFSVTAAGADLALSGSLDLGPEHASYQLELEGEHADAVGLLRSLGFDYRPGDEDLGGVSLRTWMGGDGSSVRLAGLEGRLGAIDLKGAMSVRWDGRRPHFGGVLTSTAVIALERFLPRATRAAEEGGAAAAAEAAGRWTTAPIDVGWLEAFDAELKLVAGGIVFQGYEFGAPRVTLKLADGVLDIDPLAGKLFDGDVSIRARIHGDKMLAAGIGVRLEDGDLEKALARLAGVDGVTGRFEFEGQFQTRGQNQLELISTLAGKGSLAVREGAVRGLDLAALNERLAELDAGLESGAPPGAVIETALGSGQTRIISIEGGVRVARGIGAIDGLRLKLGGGEATAKGRIDLPHWLIDLRTTFSLPNHPAAPGFAIDLSGPLDAARKDLVTGELQQFIAQRRGDTAASPGSRSESDGAARSGQARPPKPSRAATGPVELSSQGIGGPSPASDGEAN